jgi:hypothetical protein
MGYFIIFLCSQTEAAREPTIFPREQRIHHREPALFLREQRIKICDSIIFPGKRARFDCLPGRLH